MKQAESLPNAPELVRSAGSKVPAMTSIGQSQRIISTPKFSVRYMATSFCEFEPHSHLAFTMTSLLRGRMSIRVGTTDLELVEGETAFTNVGEFHSGRGFEVEFVSISVAPALVEELVDELGLLRTGSEIVFRSVLATDEGITRTAQTIAREAATEGLGHAVMLDALVRQLVIHLLRGHLTVRKSGRIEISRVGPVDRRLRRAIEFMHDNYSRELALEEIASAAYLSEYHFARLFKQITGVTPHLYLANLRLELARKLLVETNFPISEISAMVGYQSQSHFTKIFKSVSGVTPRIYRDGASRSG